MSRRSVPVAQPGAVQGPAAGATLPARFVARAAAAYRQGRLKVRQHHYYLAPTTRPEVYVNTFGLGAALAGVPVYALLDLFVAIESERYWWWHGGALTASLLTALAALLVFLAARGVVQPLPALAFGLGSCAWPVSSQALWQHPAGRFCLSLGAWLLLRSEGRPRAAAWCGAAFGMAVLCRPATAVAVICVGAYLLGGLPFLALLAAYNGHYFGSPLVFGQTVASKLIALRDTGSENLWQSAWWESWARRSTTWIESRKPSRASGRPCHWTRLWKPSAPRCNRCAPLRSQPRGSSVAFRGGCAQATRTVGHQGIIRMVRRGRSGPGTWRRRRTASSGGRLCSSRATARSRLRWGRSPAGTRRSSSRRQQRWAC